MRGRKNSASSREVPARKIEIPSLEIPKDATPEEAKELAQKFIAELRAKGVMPEKKPNEPTSKPDAETS
jgi:hypothetical protein